MRRVLLLAFATTLAAPAARAQLVFEAVRGADTLLLVGSIHALPRDSSALGPFLEAAAARATAFAFEVDFDEPNRMDEVLASRTYLPPGKTLWPLLPDSTRRRLREALPAPFHAEAATLRPWRVADLVRAQAPDHAPNYDLEWGVDNTLYRLAKRHHRPVFGLETVKFQMDSFAQMTHDEEVAYLNAALGAPALDIPEVTRLWRTGDLAAFEAYVLAPARWSAGARERLLDRRNAAWIPRLEALAAGQRLVAVVGAAHVVGDMGVPALLRARGFTVRLLPEAVAPSPLRTPEKKR